MTAPVSSRRRFLIGATLATIALPLSMRLMAQATSSALPRLPIDNPQAKALGYTDDATTTTNPKYKPGSVCSGCQFFTAATGACSVFPGFSVAPLGWCSVWTKKTA